MKFPWSKNDAPARQFGVNALGVVREGAVREDGWINPQTRLGVYGKDKTLGSYFEAELVDQETALEIWRGDDLGGRLVELLPHDMTRQGWDLNIEDDDTRIAEDVDAAAREFHVSENLYLGLCYGRALGGGGLFIIVDDGVRDLTVPLREDRIKSFLGLNLLTPRELIPYRWYGDPTKPNYGDVAIYHLMPLDAPPGSVVTDFPMVHESRIIRFNGTVTTKRARFARSVHLGWDDSIFTRIRQPLADFQAAMRATNILVQDFAPAVFKALRLAELLAAAKAKSTALNINDRLSAMEFGSSNAKVKIIDEKEEYKRESVSVAGLPELLERLMLKLAGASSTPVSLLMGQAPSGLNATGDSDIRWWYDHVAAFQKKQAYKPLRRIYRAIMAAKDGPTNGKIPENWDINFRPLWQMTPAEIAKMRFDIANADNLYIQNQTLTPEEVARRFTGDTYNTEIHIDFDERQELMEQQAERESAAVVAGREADPEGQAETVENNENSESTDINPANQGERGPDKIELNGQEQVLVQKKIGK